MYHPCCSLCNSYIIIMSIDPSLTYANVLANIEIEDLWILERSLVTPDAMTEKLRCEYDSVDEYRECLIKYWLETSVYASWEGLGRELLLHV